MKKLTQVVFLGSWQGRSRGLFFGFGLGFGFRYDGDGRRVEKVGVKTVFVYDVLGRMAAEYSTTTDNPNCVTCYLSADHLGTPRLVTDQAGNVIARHDYMSFGEEFAAGQDGRGVQWGSGGDSINQKFTGKERDSESQLDYFGARYYEYARNSPLSFVDPSGNCSKKTGQDYFTDDPGAPCVARGDTSVTVTAKAPDPDEERVRIFVKLTARALDVQLRETRNIAIETYVGSVVGYGVGRFVISPAVRAVASRVAAKEALSVATDVASSARGAWRWVVAIDQDTGSVAVGYSGPVPNAADLHPDMLSALDNAGGLGASNPGVNSRVGCCAEVDAANQLLQGGSKLDNIGFTDVINPRNNAVIPTCPNCLATFGPK